MRRNRIVGFLLVLLSTFAAAQITSPMDINEDGARAMQAKYMPQLQKMAETLRTQKYPYAFYFSRTLAMEEAQQRTVAQSGVRFERYDNRTVLAITGNYYASYSATLLDRSHRTRQTFNDVMLPVLRAAVNAFGKDEPFRAYALEISHHVRAKVLNVSTEAAENVVIVLPLELAHKLVDAKTPEQQQAAVLDAEVYVDGKPIVLWLTGDEPKVMPKGYDHSKSAQRKSSATDIEQSPVGFDLTSSDTPIVSPRLVNASTMPVRIVNPETLRQLNVEYAETIAKAVRELDPQAHFVAYAPPEFIAFKSGAYLQLAIATELPNAGGSQYKLAAMAFDQHVAHLVRPVMSYWPSASDFDGVDYSTTVKTAAGSTQSVEFIFTMSALRCYVRYDCTGQQLIDSGTVLINGERSALDLQKAQAQ